MADAGQVFKGFVKNYWGYSIDLFEHHQLWQLKGRNDHCYFATSSSIGIEVYSNDDALVHSQHMRLLAGSDVLNERPYLDPLISYSRSSKLVFIRKSKRNMTEHLREITGRSVWRRKRWSFNELDEAEVFESASALGDWDGTDVKNTISEERGMVAVTSSGRTS